MKKIISCILAICIILTLAPVVFISADEAVDPGYTGGKLIADYTFTKEFCESELGKKILMVGFNKETDGFETTYTDDGVKITQTEDSTASTAVNKFAINFSGIIEENPELNTVFSQSGFSGIYAVELTLDMGFNESNKRTDFYFNPRMVTDPTNATTTTANNLRIYTHNNSYWQGATGAYLDKWTVGKDWTSRFVFDTINGKVYLYSVDQDGNYSYKSTAAYSGATIDSVTFAPRKYVPKGQSITFKNIKIYEIQRDTESVIGAAYENFVNSVPESIVDDSSNVTESFEMPAILSSIGTVTSSDPSTVTADGIVTRGFEDKEVDITVSANSSDVYFEKTYKLIVKAREDIEVRDLAEYDFSGDDADELINLGDGNISAEGYEIKNTALKSGVIGLLKTEETSDSNSTTYYYDHNGAYDFEVSLAPYIKNGYANVELGNYNGDEFTTFGMVKITPDKVVYCDTKEDIVAVSDNTYGLDLSLKFRTLVDENKMWVWVNSNLLSNTVYSYEAAKTLNAFKVTMTDADSDDYVLLKNAKLVQQIPGNDVDVFNCLAAASNIEIQDITANPSDAYGTINLPYINGYDVEWSASSPLADLDRKYIFRTSIDTDITLSAVITSKDNPEIKVKKDFHITVLGTSDPEYLLEGALAKITPESITNQNVQNIVADISLPSKTDEGYTIVWNSLNDDIISDSGIINKNINISENTPVTLKATVVAGDYSADKTVGFVVAKRGADVEVSLSGITKTVENVVTYKANILNSDGSVYLKDNNGNKIIGLNINDSVLSLDYKNAAENTYDLTTSNFDVKVVMNSADAKANVYVNDVLVADYVPYLETATGFKSVLNSGLTLNNEKVVLDEYSLFDYNVYVFEYFSDFGNGYITDNMLFKTSSVGGVNVEWSSSDNAVMKNNGEFTSPFMITNYTVTAKLTVNGGTDANYTKTINCVAVPAEENNLLKNASVMTNVSEDITNDKTKAFDNDYSTYFVGTKIVSKSYITIDMGVIKDINSLYFFRDADDSNLISCDIYVSNDGKNWNEPVASPVFENIYDNHVIFEMQNARYIKISNIKSKNNAIKLYELKGYVSYSSDDKAHFDIMALDMPEQYILTADKITLPATGSIYGSKFTWESTDTSIISLDGNVKKPEKKTEVVLTVTAELDGKTSVKSFIYLVNGKTSAGGGASGGGGGGSANVSGVHTGGAGIAALPTEPTIEQKPSTENLKTEFNDVKVSDWYYTYLIDLKNKGIVSGYDDGTFKPSNTVTREEFVKMIISAAGIELSSLNEGFEDISANDWFAKYVYTAKENGIVNGIDENNFGTGRPVSRQDMSVIICNILNEKSSISSNDVFADDENIASYAKNAVYTMKALNVLNGYEDGTFNPTGNLTRAEAVKVISLVLTMLK